MLKKQKIENLVGEICIIFCYFCQNESVIWKSESKGAAAEFDRLYFQCMYIYLYCLRTS